MSDQTAVGDGGREGRVEADRIGVPKLDFGQLERVSLLAGLVAINGWYRWCGSWKSQFENVLIFPG